jgi:hypothetical protein
MAGEQPQKGGANFALSVLQMRLRRGDDALSLLGGAPSGYCTDVLRL